MVVLEESPWYNEILRRGEARGEARGRQAEAVSLILRLLDRRIGEIPAGLRAEIAALSLVQLETLGDALLEFGAIADLTTWLASQASQASD